MKRILLALALACAGVFVGGHGASAQDVSQRVGICDPTPYSAHSCVKPNADGSINTSATATLAGFTPGGTTAVLAVTTTSADVALPAGTVVKVVNWGANDVHFRVTVAAGTAVTTDEVLKAGAATGVTVGSNTHLSAITDSSTSSLSLAGGSGLVSGYGGGGATSGGATAALQTTGNTSLATIATNSGSSIPAGAAIIGKTGIDQTTPGTTNNVTLSTNVGTLPIVQATASAAITFTAAGGPTQIIAASGSTKIYVTHIHYVLSGAGTFALVTGTGTNCGTGTTYLEGASSHPLSYAANGGISAGSGLGPIYVTGAGGEICAITTGAVDTSGTISYAQF